MLAHLSDAAAADGLTTSGVALGTPAYMFPEQATAEPCIDHREDIYAVGALAYERNIRTTSLSPEAHLTNAVNPQSANALSMHRKLRVRLCGLRGPGRAGKLGHQ
jgi:serine/threonine protein kinase